MSERFLAISDVAAANLSAVANVWCIRPVVVASWAVTFLLSSSHFCAMPRPTKSTSRRVPP